jgi:hypothetical protein
VYVVCTIQHDAGCFNQGHPVPSFVKQAGRHPDGYLYLNGRTWTCIDFINYCHPIGGPPDEYYIFCYYTLAYRALGDALVHVTFVSEPSVFDYGMLLIVLHRR